MFHAPRCRLILRKGRHDFAREQLEGRWRREVTKKDGKRRDALRHAFFQLFDELLGGAFDAGDGEWPEPLRHFPFLRYLVFGFADTDQELLGDVYGAYVAAHILAVLLEHVELLLKALISGRAIPAVGIFRDQFEHYLFTAATDGYRRMRFLDPLGIVDRVGDRVVAPLEVCAFLGEHLLEDFEPLRKLLEPLSHRRELVTVRLVFLGHPSCAEADFEASARDLIDGTERLSEQGGVAVRIADHQRADSNRFGCGREPAHRGKAFDVVEIGHLPGPHVIHQPDGMKTELLAQFGAVEKRFPVEAGLWREQSELRLLAHSVAPVGWMANALEIVWHGRPRGVNQSCPAAGEML